MSKLFKNKQKADLLKRSKTEEYRSYEAPFVATRTIFRNVVGYEPLSYEEWLNVPDHFKAAALYVTFFNQITLAWSKAKSFYVDDEDGVSTLLQYLVKNTPLIKDNEKKYTPGYIYKIAYNCMYCVSRDIKRDKDAYENNTSQYIQCGEDVLDLFDTVPSIDNIDDLSKKKKFWSIIDNVDDDTFEVIANLIDHSRMPAGLGKKKASIIEDLRSKLEEVSGLYNEVNTDDAESFSYVMENDDDIASATVVLPNGNEAVYYGEKIMNEAGYVTAFEFFGADKDYYISVDVAATLKVTDIERY